MENEIIEETKFDSEEFVYQIYNGSTEDEYYTFDTPVLDKLVMKCTAVKKKEEITVGIVNKTLSAFFSSEQLGNKDFDLSEGVVVRLFNYSDVPWLFKTELQAKEELKEKELDFYRKALPELIRKVEGLSQTRQIPTVTQAPNKLTI